MEMSKQVQSCSTSSVVQFIISQHTQQGALASIHITKNSKSNVQKLKHTEYINNSTNITLLLEIK